ncbi:MAG: hypothetical protein OEU36_15280 [Gammaproteobacteria bacterium]|nr:hypothetical protein [Gammaproteobacteria bacterium]
MSKLIGNAQSRAVWAVIIGAATVLSACGGGGSSSSGAGGGSATVTGNVSQFSGGQAFLMPADRPEGVSRIADLFVEFMIRSAWANMAGLEVSLGGSEDLTDADGSFELTNVAAGAQRLCVSNGVIELCATVSGVAPNSEITYEDVTCTETQCSIGKITVASMDDGISDDSSGSHAQKKVVICHKGKNISVGAPAVPAHQAHGDTIGACVSTDHSTGGDTVDESEGETGTNTG